MHWNSYTLLTHPSSPGLWSQSGSRLPSKELVMPARGTAGHDRTKHHLHGKDNQDDGYCYRADRQSLDWK